jgi:imidazolonepropionase-like amidohydrolase
VKTRSILLVAMMLMSCAVAAAQQIGNPTIQQGIAGQRSTYVIRNAHIVPVTGPAIDNGSVVVRDGKIIAVGTSVTPPAGAEEIDARGLSIYPGMIDVATAMGLVEVPQGAPGTVDTTEVGDYNPNVQAIVAVNAHSAHIGVTRVDGITSVVTMPQGGVVSGQAALINLNGTSAREMAVVPSVALVINFPRLARGFGDREFSVETPANQNITEALNQVNQQIEQLRKLLKNAEAYGRAQDAYAKDPKLPRPDINITLAPLVPFVRGERPVVLRASRETEIRAAVRFADEMKLKAIILGGEDSPKVAALLKEKNVPVILTGNYSLPLREDDYYDALYEAAAKLQAAGVRFCISTGSSGAAVRNLPQYAGMAAAFGLSKDEALKAVTLYPAQIMNVADRMGSIEVGKMANLVVTDGDLLEVRTHVRYLFIDGVRVPLTSRHTELYDAFKDRK